MRYLGSVVTTDNAFAGMSRLTRSASVVAAGQLMAAFPGRKRTPPLRSTPPTATMRASTASCIRRDHSHPIAYPQAKNKGGSYAVLDGTTDIDANAR